MWFDLSVVDFQGFESECSASKKPHTTVKVSRSTQCYNAHVAHAPERTTFPGALRYALDDVGSALDGLRRPGIQNNHGQVLFRLRGMSVSGTRLLVTLTSAVDEPPVQISIESTALDGYPCIALM